ncbi:NUDIX hydrolase (macronuclear) [Tetrahymena thermophila SB210]|uniref:Oxidized purine nucleoside triphosphate hydrolase n=1 Tax=Tetrahymena thermophila (strain SB210) TaxID=312017 RepID=Q23GB1_TETTS|nr:NUDIX hydrolase [Tetrahymena thermophila SB210]EAR95349.2 NUDIX hydrolase [Tetrahymena thermophila SB210]|eukprot:XP_001015594.2 NUDIX hydrolase [Tetrahymena thermophila SB210]
MNNSQENFDFKNCTTCYLIQENKVLLGFKKRGFGIAKWNGFGGKVDSNETILQGAIREMQEECNITPTKLKFVGLIKYTLPKLKMIILSHQFIISEYEGSIQESEEMRPQWFEFQNIPFQDMWCENHIWFGDLLKQNYFYGEYTMDGPEDLYSSMNKIVEREQLYQLQKQLSNRLLE